MAQSYVPKVHSIIAITQGAETIVQTEEDHDYIAGNTVTFIVPPDFGMIELSGKKALVLEVTDDTLTVNINSLRFSTFVVPADFYTPAQVVPMGDVNTGFQGPDAITPLGIPGSFRIIKT